MGGNATRSLVLATSGLIAWLFAVGLSIVPIADAAPFATNLLDAGKTIRSDVVEIKKRGRKAARFVPPIAPSYQSYDYPYYYSRGHYPTHIRPGYIYYGYPYSYYSRSYHPEYGHCSAEYRGCVAGWRHRLSRRQKAR